MNIARSPDNLARWTLQSDPAGIKQLLYKSLYKANRALQKTIPLISYENMYVEYSHKYRWMGGGISFI